MENNPPEVPVEALIADSVQLRKYLIQQRTFIAAQCKRMQALEDEIKRNKVE